MQPRDRSLTLVSSVVIPRRERAKGPLPLLSSLSPGQRRRGARLEIATRAARQPTVGKKRRRQRDGLIAAVIRYDGYAALHFPSRSAAGSTARDLRVYW